MDGNGTPQNRCEQHGQLLFFRERKARTMAQTTVDKGYKLTASMQACKQRDGK